MERIRSLFFLLFLITISPAAVAQPVEQLPVLLLDSRFGLKTNKVRDITHMPDGRMGIFSPISIECFDGQHFQEFSTLNTPAYQLKTDNNYRILGNDNQHIHWCKEKKQLWGIDLNSVSPIVDVGKKINSWGVTDSIIDFHIDDKGNVWMLTTDNTLYYRTASSPAKAAYPSAPGNASR